MKKTVCEIFFALLRFEVCGEALCESAKEKITPTLLPPLFKLSKNHDMAHIVAVALDKNGFLPSGTEARARFMKERDTAIYRYRQQQYAFEQICRVFEEKEIYYQPLKGCVLRRFYPDEWLRTSCDIDILIDKAQLDLAQEALCSTLSYTKGEKGEKDVHLYSPSGVHLELHFSLDESDESRSAMLRAAERVAVDGYRYRLAFSDEMLYFYHIVHMATHMRGGGCGVKSLLDLHIMKKSLRLDRERLDALLSEGGLSVFSSAVSSLADVWFADGVADGTASTLAEFILSGGSYGALENRVAVAQMKKGGRVKYLLARAFIGYGEMKLKYPSLRRAPFLFPFYQVYRWFDLFINKESRGYAKATVRSVQNTSQDLLSKTKDLFDSIGI